MGIKWIKNSETKSAVPFPKLMRGRNNDNIILMEKDGVGTVLYAGSQGLYPIGHHSATWVMACFKDYNEAFTIQNEEN